MGSKKRQQKRLFINRVKSILTWVLLISMSTCCLAFAVTYAVVYSNIRTNNLYEYFGTYEVKVIPFRRNTNYLFKLGNGDNVVVKPELMEAFDGSTYPKELFFSYSEPKDILCSAYTAVEIENIDDNTIVLSTESSLIEAFLGTCFSAILCILSLVLCLLMWICSPLRHNRRKLRKG